LKEEPFIKKYYHEVSEHGIDRMGIQEL